jgi:hypothetical protein
MWFDYGMQKNKHSWSWQSWSSIMYKTLANGGICQKFILASSHTTSTAQSPEQPSRHKE